VNSILGLDLPTFKEIEAKKSLPFPGSSGNDSSPLIIFPDLNSMSAAVLASISPQSQPSSDPHLSSLVAAGVTWLANTLPEPDLQVKKNFQRKRGGKKRDDDVIERHPFYQLIDEPNPEDTGSDLWKAFAYSWIIAGNVYFYKIRNDFGQVVRLYYEPHFSIRARWIGDKQGEYILAERSQSVPSVPRTDDPTLKINYYEVDREGGKFRLEPADVIHFKDGIDPTNTRYGISRMQTILREIYQDSAVASYAADLLGGNGVIPFVIGVDDKDGIYSQIDLDNLKTRIIAQTTGTNARTPVVLNARHTFTRTALTPQELDLRTSRSMAQDVFSAVTGIPAIVLNFSSGMEHSIYNNMSEADRRAVTSYLQPIWWHRDQVLTRQLLRDLDQDETHFIESDLSEVGALQEDQNEVWERVGLAYQNGLIKRSEARTAIDYEADPGGADDVYFVRSGSETVTLEGEAAAHELAMNPPEPAPLQIGDGQQPPMKLVKSLPRAEQEKIREHWERHAPDRLKGLITAKGK
jgi:HK97 family phage portal protein